MLLINLLQIYLIYIYLCKWRLSSSLNKQQTEYGIQFCAKFSVYTFWQVLSNSIVNSKSIKLWLNLISKCELATVVSISFP